MALSQTKEQQPQQQTTYVDKIATKKRKEK
jgi:hypothetical protein